ncbi:MAG TPA: ABC transporter substrate-binding protein [Acidimicrobiales bacterium]
MFGLVVGACSSGTDGAASDETGTPDTTEGAFDRDGVVNVGIDLVQANLFTFDPAQMQGTPSMDAVYALVYGRLLRQAADGSLGPGLAESAVVVDENTIDIELHEGMTWQDGEPFDAESVKAGLDYTLASNNRGGLGTAFFSVSSVDVTGPTSVQLKINDGTAASWFDTYISGIEATIVRPGSDFSKPVGAGPMAIASYSPQKSLTLERFDEYWEADEVDLGGMTFIHTDSTQPQAATNALRAGQIDVASLTVDQLPSLGGDLKEVSVPDASRMFRVVPCKRDGALADPKVRIAMNKAIDRSAISEVVFAGTAEPGVELWPEGHRLFTEAVAEDLAYDPEGARQLLAEAGYPDGLSFDLWALNALNLPVVAEVLEQQLAAVGITANLVVSNELLSGFLQPEAPGAAILPGTPNSGLEKLEDYQGESLGNVCSYDDPELNTLIAQLAKVSENSDAAVAIWDQINTLYAEKALGVVLGFSSNIGGYNSSRLTMNSTYPGGLFVVPDIYDSHMNS